MQQTLGVIVTAVLIALAPFPAAASEQAKKGAAGKTPAAHTAGKARPATPPVPAHTQATEPPGDTLVHRGLQGWANGMNRAARAMKLDNDPLEGRLPGARRPSHNPGLDPFDNDPTR